jgi:hypothetical protein
MREHGPTVVLAAALLAVLGIRVAAPDRPATAEAGAAKESKPARSGPEAPAGSDQDDTFWGPLAAFRRTHAVGLAAGGGGPTFEGKSVWPGFPDVEGWDLHTLLVTLPDPVDSTSAYQFDTVVDALQRAVETRGYVLDRYYYPWSGQKGKAAGEKEGPLELTAGAPRLTTGELRLTVREADKGRRFEREPGALLFRAAFRSDDHPPPGRQGRLLLVLLVGETATAGAHKEALTAGLRLVARSAGYRLSGTAPLLGPFFSGGQVSLAAAVRGWAREDVHRLGVPALRVLGAPPPLAPLLAACALAPGNAKDLRIMSGSATGVDVPALTDSCRPAAVSFEATVVPDIDIVVALLDHLRLVEWDRQSHSFVFRDVACLSESNTAFGRNLLDKLKARYELERPNPGRPPAPDPQPAGRRHGLTVLPFPLHISDVRAAYGKGGDAAAVNTLSLPSFGKNLRVPLEAGKPPRDTEPSLEPAMAAVQSERVLSGLLNTIAQERFRYAIIAASDVKDRLFLASQLRLHAPDTRLLFVGGDLLLSHPDYRADLRGAVVGSSYPLYLPNQHWSFPARGDVRHLLFPGDAEQGCYNATVFLLGGDPDDLLDYGPPFPSLQRGPWPRKPPVWISVLGQEGPQPLTAVPTGAIVSYTAEVPPAAFRPPERAEARPPAGQPPEFRATSTGLWIVPTLGVALLLLTVALGYADLGGGARRSFWRPRGPGQWVYPLTCLVAVFGVYVYVAGVWSIPAWQVWRLPSSPVAWKWWHGIAPTVAGLLFLGFVGLVVCSAAAAAWADREATAKALRAWGAWLATRRGLLRAALLLAAALALVLAWRAWDWFPNAVAVVVIVTLLALVRVGPTQYRLLLLVVFLVTVVTLYLWRNWPPRYYPSGEVEQLFCFERATSLASGVSPVVPVLLLGLAFFWWGWRHLKRLWLLEEHKVKPPFPPGGTFAKVKACADKAWGHLVSPHSAGGTWAPLIWLALFFTFCRVAGRFVPSVEGTFYDALILFALALFAVLLVDAVLHLIATWHALAELLRALGGLRHLNAAFKRLPPEATRLFGLYLSSERPGRETHMPLRQQQQRRLVADFPAARAGLHAALALGPGPSCWRGLAPLNLLAPGLDQDLTTTARRCLVMLSRVWTNAAARAALTGPLSGAAGDWVAAAEEFAALEVVAYLSQYFVQLRNLLWFLWGGPLLMLFAVSSYPFQPQGLWLLFAGGLVAIVTGVVLWIITAIERDAVVSTVLHTDPDKVNFHWAFLGHVLKYALPLLGIVVAASSDVSDLLHAWIDPVLRVIR